MVKARNAKDAFEIYNATLMYLLVKKQYKGVTPPDEVYDKLFKPKTKPKPAGQIIQDITRKLG